MNEPTIDVTRYTYRVTWWVEDDQYVATCLELPSLSWLTGQAGGRPTRAARPRR